MAKRNHKPKTKKNVVDPQKRPEEFIKTDGAIYWEANADKSKRYGPKEFQNKEFLTLKEAEIFLQVDSDWMSYFMHGLKGFPKLPFEWDKKNPRTLKFARADLVKYRESLPKRKSSTKTRAIKK